MPKALVVRVDTRALDNAIQRAKNDTSQAIAGMERGPNKLDKRFNRMAAISSAQAAMATTRWI